MGRWPNPHSRSSLDGRLLLLFGPMIYKSNRQASFLLIGIISSDAVYSFARFVSASARLKSVHAVVVMPGKRSAWVTGKQWTPRTLFC
jgi:hypothetical protein